MNTKYKMIATDCDGTLLDSQGYLPERNKRILQALFKKGIKTVLATGRSDILASDYALELGFECPVIGCNGATIAVFGEPTKRSYVKAMSAQQLMSLYTLLSKESVPYKAFTVNACYMQDENLLTGGMGLVVRKYTKKLKASIPYIKVENMKETVKLTDVIKCVVIDNDLGSLKRIQDAINEIEGLKAMKSNVNCIDIIRDDISKASAMLEYAATHNIKTEEIIAFGDNENDISMLKAAGLGVAVENAAENVKASADLIGKTNDECAVAEILEELFSEFLK